MRRTLSFEEDALLAAEADNVRAALDWLSSRPGPEQDLLAIELGGVAALSLVEAGGVSEAFDRTVVLSARVSTVASPEIIGRYWRALAYWGAVVGRSEAYDAALRGADALRELGDDERLFLALGCRIAIGARLGEGPALRPHVEEARRIERAEWAKPRHTWFQWACYRWLQAEGRPEEALDFALAGRPSIVRTAHRCSSRSPWATSSPIASWRWAASTTRRPIAATRSRICVA